MQCAKRNLWKFIWYYNKIKQFRNHRWNYSRFSKHFNLRSEHAMLLRVHWSSMSAYKYNSPPLRFQFSISINLLTLPFYNLANKLITHFTITDPRWLAQFKWTAMTFTTRYNTKSTLRPHKLLVQTPRRHFLPKTTSCQVHHYYATYRTSSSTVG